ncbi:MAG: tRNA preQ1(34) S-adenosylmethionine ribosyltransferase-isomerase QueA [Bdellovibrionales bacterium RIFOXYC1_FULL_54_43]|nr:MAG: tRNA preQ1(34) S-adenosylmethionine ribosyltransferase-isomerase QueA [Bdellovibrionales bacterium RIFOXYC1_FULL_54_43]OFZ83671.1 MAG: tRNA preQ1(34) S-adenosylmethionine ribosyltransferase-isomerase QueA [Bdellovibrionales bacterium RIFOXYD1_FULL_55_31]
MDPNPDLNSLAAYDYELPERLIAQEPAMPRDSSRLLVVDRARGVWEHRSFRDFPSYFDSNDLLVANNTKVMKARLLGRRLKQDPGHLYPVKGGKVEFVLLEKIAGHGPHVWEGLFRASARYNPGLRFEIITPDGQCLRGVLVRGSSESPHGTVWAEFDRDPVESGAGEIPLPHYISRGSTKTDEAGYQTVYAKHIGSAAAPTAGLHFTNEIMRALAERSVSWAEVTLHVGLGTFRPVKSNDIRDHVMHEERYEISSEVAGSVRRAKADGKRVVAIGTTSVRTLESAWKPRGLEPGVGRTSLFIWPGRPGGHPFHVVDRMLTNFHLPRSTLLMLVCAFAGRDLILAAYREAVAQEYRFFSYGDAMLIL